MANKLLKTLTIGSNSMDVYDPPLGLIASPYTHQKSVSANTWTNMNVDTSITKSGTYIIQVYVYFSGTGTTGTRNCYLQVNHTNSEMNAISSNSLSNIPQADSITIVEEITAPDTVTARVFTGVACNVNCGMRISRVPEYDS